MMQMPSRIKEYIVNRNDQTPPALSIRKQADAVAPFVIPPKSNFKKLSDGTGTVLGEGYGVSICIIPCTILSLSVSQRLIRPRFENANSLEACVCCVLLCDYMMMRIEIK
jgi:hypothetical protein